MNFKNFYLAHTIKTINVLHVQVKLIFFCFTYVKYYIFLTAWEVYRISTLKGFVHPISFSYHRVYDNISQYTYLDINRILKVYPFLRERISTQKFCNHFTATTVTL